MVSVAEIAAKAMDGVQAKIVDAIQAVTFGAETGRIVFDQVKAPNGYPSPTEKDRVETAYLEGWPLGLMRATRLRHPARLTTF